MSLINQVLEDLDKRRLEETNVSGVDDLHYAQVQPKLSNSKKIVLFSLIGMVVVAAIAVYLLLINKPSSQTSSVAVEDKSTRTAKPSVASEPRQAHAKKTTITPAKTKPVATKKTVVKKIKPVPTVVMAEPVQSVNAAEESLAVVDSLDAGTPFKKKVVPLRTEQRAELAYQAGYDELKSKHYNLAEQSLRQALAIEPDHIKARELLSGIFIQQGRWVEAGELLRKGVELAPGHRTFSKLYARSLMQLGRDAKAIEVLEQSRPGVQDDPNYFAILAALYQRQSRHALAADTYAAILKVNSNNGVWWVGLGISLEALGRTGEASQAYAHARKTGNLQAEVSRFTDNRLLALEEVSYPAE